MADNNKRSNSFIIQGMILSIASIVSRIIGLFYRMPLTAIIGDIGNDYYSSAYEIYSLMLLISSYSLPMAVSKMVSARMASKKRTDAIRVFNGAIMFAVITGGAGCLIVLLGATKFTYLIQTPMAVYALRVLAPTVLIVAILGALRGFFQGLGSMIPSAISQILEQIVNAVVSIGAAYILFGYGMRVATSLNSSEHYAEAYGAAGGTLGTCLGALFGLLFVLFVLFTFRPKMKKMLAEDKKIGRKSESYSNIFKVMVLTIIPILLSTTIYNLVTIVDLSLFKNLAAVQGLDAEMVSTSWGVFSGKYRVLANVPISIASAMAVSCVPAITAALARKDKDDVKRKIGLSLRTIMIVVMPCAVGLAALASPIMQLLYNDSSRLPMLLIQTGAISIIFYSISTLSNATLQGIDKMRIPVRNAIISLGIHVVAIIVSMLVFKLEIYAVIIGQTVFSLSMCLLNGMAVKKYSGFKPEIKKTFVTPAISALIMGAVVGQIHFLGMKIFASNIIWTIVSIVVGAGFYFVFLIKIKGINEAELRAIPKGAVLVKIAKKFRLF